MIRYAELEVDICFQSKEKPVAEVSRPVERVCGFVCVSVFAGYISFIVPSQECQSTESVKVSQVSKKSKTITVTVVEPLSF